MSTTSDLITVAVLFGPGITAGGAIAWTYRGARADSASVLRVLADSAAERAAAAVADGPEGTPPGDREPAPATEPAPTVRLATVLPFPSARRVA